MAGAQKGALTDAQEFTSITGKGVMGRVAGRPVALGNQALFEELGIAVGELAEHAEAKRREGQTVMFVAVDGQPAGLLGWRTRSSPRPWRRPRLRGWRADRHAHGR